jgi:hypothetical protein
MAFSTIYTFFSGTQQIQVIRSDDDPTYISYNVLGPTGAPNNQPPEGQTMQVICSGYDQYTYKAKNFIPYATFSVIPNSGSCGYTPPACDIYVQSFVVTDETAPDANDGTVNMFAISSYGGIVYYLYGSGTGLLASNTTGYFTGLAPDTYTVDAIDANPCEVQGIGTVQPFDDTTLTHYKYKMEFTSANGTITWQVRLYDMLNNYLKTDYPKEVDGAEASLILSQRNQEEDKTSAIVSKTASIVLLFDGDIFTTEEFTDAIERQWYVEVYNNDEIEFKGWLLPDETQDYYEDPSYFITLTATDGIPSLKGNTWGNGTGGNGYSTSQYQQYGLAKWADLVKQCLDQLGYDYGNVTILSSLRFNNTYSTSLWNDIGTWSDILYDGDGVALDTYSALELLLSGMKLCILQHKGKFVLVNWNDVSYALNSLKATEYNLAFYETDLVSLVGTSPVAPMYQAVGIAKPIQPINPPQNLNFDKAYNIKASINFNLLALLYTNPGFEIGSIEGEIPTGFSYSTGTIVGSGLTQTDAYEGGWSFKIGTNGRAVNVYLENNNPPGFIVDQQSKAVGLSFMWKVPYLAADPAFGKPAGYVYDVAIVFIDGTSGNAYFLETTDSQSIDYYDYNESGEEPQDAPVENKWTALLSRYFSEGDAFGVKGRPVTDNTGWNSFDVTTPQLPETGQGLFTVRLYGVKIQLFDPENYPALLSTQKKRGFYLSSDTGYYLIDNLQITTQDTQTTYNKQIGEVHTVTAVTSSPQADVKELDLKLFTYPTNKRVAGNVFSTTPYTDGEVSNNWNFALKTLDAPDRLPAIIAKAFARTYQRRMYIFEGDFKSPYAAFYGIFTIEKYPNKIFMPYQIDLDCRNETGHIVLIEIDDNEAQNVYKYTPVYEKSSRRNY